ncbi:MAG TPA: peptide ABC transporter substrate-binding protein [Candidatus Dormibacteraeota bacterium]
MLAALTACSTNAPASLRTQSQSLSSDQILRVRLPDGPRSLDPALVQDERELAVVRQFSEPLLKPTADERDVQPAAAESYTVSDDGLTYTFRLRGNGRYADGSPVRAQDFVYAWRRLIDPRTAAPQADFFARIVQGGEEANALDPRHDADRVDPALAALGLQAQDDLTFVVKLPGPMAAAKWIAALPEGGPLRADMLKAPGTNGNGPFRVTETTKDQVTLAPNNSYWGGRPTLSTLTFTFGSDAAAVTKYKAGDLDVVVNPPDPVSADVVKVPELTTFWIDFNVERAPFQDSRVRQAFAMAVDREALVGDQFKGRAGAATTLIPRGMNGYHPEDGKPEETNAAAAKQQLDAVGVPHDQLTGLPMIVHDRPLDRAIAEAVVAQWNRALGVSVSIQALNAVDYDQRLRSGNFTLAGPTGWTADYPDPQDFFDLFRSTDGNNGARWRNARYDALIRVADIESDETKRDALYNQAHQLLESDAPVVFLVQRWDWSLVKPYVKGAPLIPVDEWPGATYSNLLYVAAH